MVELRGYGAHEPVRNDHVYNLSRQDYYHHRPDYYPQQPPSEYSTPSGHYADRLFPEFSNEYSYSYDNPSSSVSSSTTVSNRTPRIYGHIRTPSNVSNASSCGGTGTSNVNPTFRFEGDDPGNVD